MNVIRIGTILKIFREDILGVSLKGLEEELQTKSSAFPISVPAWSTYELGNRSIGNPSIAFNTIVTLIDLLGSYTEIKIENKESLQKKLYASYFNEKMLYDWLGIFPLKYAAVKVLQKYIEANYIYEDSTEPPISGKDIFSAWLNQSEALRSSMVKWIIGNSRFVRLKKLSGDFTVAIAERAINKPKKQESVSDLLLDKPLNFISFSDVSDYLDSASKETLLFEYIGAAFDVLMLLTTGYKMSEDLSSLQIEVIGVKEPICLNAAWFDDINRIWKNV